MSGLIGQQLADYRIIEYIGAGGMGQVFLAEHVHLRKQYAVKVLPAELAQDRNFLARFHDEARVMAELRHPHIVQVHAMSQADGVYFLAMDYVTGPDGKPLSLHEHLKNQPDARMPETYVKKCAIQIAEALAYAHERGVVHRDLKPANILVDGNGDVKLTDFGLAKAIGNEFILSQMHATMRSLGTQPTLRAEAPGQTTDTLGAAVTQLDQSGDPVGGASSILGTYDYMSPEQRGESGGQVDQRTDIYAFGVVLYRLLTGKRPTGLAKPPSQLSPELSPLWDYLVARCLADEPAQRWENAAAMLVALRACGSTQWRARTLSIAAVLVTLVATVAIAYVWRSPPQSFRAPQGSASSSGSLPIAITQPAVAEDVSAPVLHADVNSDSQQSRAGEKAPAADDATRTDAETARNAMHAARDAARQADAATLAADNWNNAEELAGQANVQFETNCDFAAARRLWEAAMAGYTQAGTVARVSTAAAADRRAKSEELDSVRGEYQRISQDNRELLGQYGRDVEELAQAQQAARSAAQSCSETSDLKVAWDGYRTANDLLNRAVAIAKQRKEAAEQHAHIASLLTEARTSAKEQQLDLDRGPSAPVTSAQSEAARRILERVNRALELSPQDVAAGKLAHQLNPWAVNQGVLALDCGDGVTAELVLVPAGTLTLGASDGFDNEQPPHLVTTSRSFYIGVTEVTRVQWRAVMGSDASRLLDDPNLPVEGVSWDDCQMFCKKLSAKTGKTVRLPTEAEWEYACRAGTVGRFSFGDSAQDLGDYAWFNGNSVGRSHRVGTKKPNAWGLYDMHGNVWEWCAIWHEPDSSGAQHDPLSPESRSCGVLRGGSCNVDSSQCRSASRGEDEPVNRGGNVGFRIAAESE